MKKLASLVVAASMPLTAHAAARMVSQSGDWGVYSFMRNGSRVCYALSVPKESAPANVDHGKNYFLIAPAQKGGGNEPEAILGYALKSGSTVEASIGERTFKMFVKGNSAWVSDAALEPEFVDALRSGSQLTLHATSARGTRTTYAYSLTGVTAALERIAQCK
ncbi:putative signal peptide protein (plasmid) [Rhizobium leguminosarum bv. trifolii WSM1325]|uniref:Putative signal peptide protein n=1 Tax=Rhizobium leguminosarum bv. trifolii (strain WSM1325) TaxID=395491 RepID=C6B8K9_RHILS|nr:invasion associated locus B family protein [Rhizobium leguminosarum]ACS60247.1 putative signal peptide protein [Rhizobium leguminosarum bv. trifolii WSM1325]